MFSSVWKRRFRWRRFSVRTLLICVTLSAVFFAYCGQRLLRAHKERTSIARITELGGTVNYSGSSVLENQNGLSKLIAVFFYEDFSRVTSVGFEGVSFTDAAIEPLKGLSSLQHIGLSGANVDETALNRLQRELPNVYVYE